MNRFIVVFAPRSASLATVSILMSFHENSDSRPPTRIERESSVALAQSRGQTICGVTSHQLIGSDRSTNTLWHSGMSSDQTFHICATSRRGFKWMCSAVIAAIATQRASKLITDVLVYSRNLMFRLRFQLSLLEFLQLSGHFVNSRVFCWFRACQHAAAFPPALSTHKSAFANRGLIPLQCENRWGESRPTESKFGALAVKMLLNSLPFNLLQVAAVKNHNF
jgi:hypothetical protein